MPAVAATSMKPSLAPPEIVLASEFSSLRVALDGQTGGPVRVWDDSTGLDVSAAVVLREGGGEVRGPAGGLSYPGTTDVAIAGPAGPLRERVLLDGRQFVVPVATTQPERWSLVWRYELREEWQTVLLPHRSQRSSDHAGWTSGHWGFSSRPPCSVRLRSCLP